MRFTVNRERDYLHHILECIEAIEQYTANRRESLDDPKTEDAVIRRLQVMAESCLRLTDEVTVQHPEVGWQHIRNFRNRLVHQYLEIDIDLVWTIIQNDLPPLKFAVEQFLKS